MAAISDLWSLLSKESGLKVVVSSSKDVKLLFLQRFIRLFAYGSTFIILIQFLSSLDISDKRIGFFLTLTLLGDTAISLVLSQITDRVGRRRVLAAGALLMSFSGVVFVLSSNFWILLLASIVGVISPSGNEIGPFRAVEESILSRITDDKVHSDFFAWYSMCGTFGAALGTLGAGWALQALQDLDDWSTPATYRTLFAVYALIGAAKFGLVLMLSQEVEMQHQILAQDDVQNSHQLEEVTLMTDIDGSEERPSSSPDAEAGLRPPERPKSRLRSFLPDYSRKTLSILARLLPLFTMDSFASGLAAPSWLTDFFLVRHDLSPSSLGTLFFATNILATISNLVALPIARRLGPLRTMAFTHLPSAICLSLIAVPPAGNPGTWIAMLLLALRASTQSMDQAPRQAFLAAIVLPTERTAVYGVVNTVKTMSQAAGIGIAGVFAEAGLWLGQFGGAGLLKASYDILLLVLFYNSRDQASPS